MGIGAQAITTHTPVMAAKCAIAECAPFAHSIVAGNTATELAPTLATAPTIIGAMGSIDKQLF